MLLLNILYDLMIALFVIVGNSWPVLGKRNTKSDSPHGIDSQTIDHDRSLESLGRDQEQKRHKVYQHHPKGLVLGVLNGFLVRETNKTTPFGGSRNTVYTPFGPPTPAGKQL